MNCGFGYEPIPFRLIEKKGNAFFGIRNGAVYSIDSLKRQVVWAHKIDNPMINTVRETDKQDIIVSTMDGKIVLIEVNHIKIN
jgi:outer membrane protein assembly factor BamB